MHASGLVASCLGLLGESDSPEDEDETNDDWVWSSLGPALVAAGDTTSALRYITAIDDDWNRSTALTEAARILAGFGDLPAAEQFAQEADDTTGQRSEGLQFVARAALAAHDFATASRIADGIGTPGIRAATLAELAMAQTDADDAPGAQATIAAVTGIAYGTIYHEAICLTAIAPAAARHGRRHAVELCEQAWRHAVQLSTHPRLQDVIFVSIAHALGQLDEAGRAGEAARLINDPAARASTLAGLSHSLAGTAHAADGLPFVREAGQIAQSVTDVRTPAKAFTAISRALAAHGEWEQAQQVVEKIAASPSRADALTELAVQAMDDGRDSLAWQLTGLSLTFGLPWSPTYAVIGRLDPDLLITFAIETMGSDEHQAS